jgi:hypothetical protein
MLLLRVATVDADIVLKAVEVTEKCLKLSDSAHGLMI